MDDQDKCQWCDTRAIVDINGIRGCRTHLQLVTEKAFQPIQLIREANEGD